MFFKSEKLFKSENVFQIRKSFSNPKMFFKSRKVFQISKMFFKLPLTFDLLEPMAGVWLFLVVLDLENSFRQWRRQGGVGVGAKKLLCHPMFPPQMRSKKLLCHPMFPPQMRSVLWFKREWINVHYVALRV